MSIKILVLYNYLITRNYTEYRLYRATYIVNGNSLDGYELHTRQPLHKNFLQHITHIRIKSITPKVQYHSQFES